MCFIPVVLCVMPYLLYVDNSLLRIHAMHYTKGLCAFTPMEIRAVRSSAQKLRIRLDMKTYLTRQLVFSVEWSR